MADLYFFPEQRWGSHPSTNFYAKWLNRRGFTQGRAFWSKNQNFLKPLTPRLPKPSNFGKFLDLENFGEKSPIIKFPPGNDP